MRPARPLLAALALALVAAAPVPAAQTGQLEREIERRLPRYGLSADVSRFDVATLVALFTTLNRKDSHFKTRRALRVILSNPGYE